MILKLSLLIIGLVIITLKRGVYISQDPIGLAGGANPYSYTHDVNMWLDVFGLAKEFEIGTYGSLKGGDNIGDELDAHELL